MEELKKLCEGKPEWHQLENLLSQRDDVLARIKQHEDDRAVLLKSHADALDQQKKHHVEELERLKLEHAAQRNADDNRHLERIRELAGQHHAELAPVVAERDTHRQHLEEAKALAAHAVAVLTTPLGREEMRQRKAQELAQKRAALDAEMAALSHP